MRFGQTPKRIRIAPYAAIPTPADAGIVMIHAQKILRATPQRTADKRFVIVRTMRQPPKNVPSEMEAWAPTMTQNGTANWPDEGPQGGPIAATTRMRVMIPIPF